MEQKDYKEIARINEEYKDFFKDEDVYASFCEEQADYFEREDQRVNVGRVKGTGSGVIMTGLFNKKQFLKDCGVSE